MTIPVKKLKTGFEIPIFGIGTWKMGGGFERDPKNDDEKDIRAIQEAIHLGITHIDTAEIYANGYAEKLVGQAIKKYKRSKLFITSKIPSENLKYDKVLKSIEQSLKRLDTHYLDLYLIHDPSLTIPLKETMRAMNRLIDEKIIKNIGVSNFAVKRFQQAQACSNNKIVCNQVHYNLIFREPEKKGLLEYCQKNDVILNAWRPVQKGTLAKSGITIVDKLSKKYNKSPAQIAINWLISQKNVITISKASNIDHLKDNLEAIGWKLSKTDIEKLRKDFPNQKDKSDTIVLK